jgi:hypothetical protein
MVTKRLIIGVLLVLALGTTTIAFAKEKQEYGNVSNRRNVEINYSNRPNRNSMLALMEQYGYGDLALDIKNGDYAALEDHVDNLSDEDYQRMIDIMKENGYANMASRMERIGTEGMISMHRAMGGAAGCYR